MTVEIALLGTPSAHRDGEPVSLRGQKAWALLALLLLADGPVARERLTRLLFVDADDPDGALRWNLSHLRRALEIGLAGDPIEVTLGPDVNVDVLALRHGDAGESTELASLDDELLAGVGVDAHPTFEVWLEAERRHVRRLTVDVRSEAALARLGRGDTTGAVELAQKVAQAEPLDENAAALLVRCLRADGRPEEARTVAEQAAARLRSELGVEPTGVLWTAVSTQPPGGDRRATGSGAVVAQLEAGEAAVAAGALDTGVGALRSAVVAARALGDGHLLARSLAALGSALIHGVRGVDQDGLALLHEAEPMSEAHGDTALTTQIRREIGYVDFLRARYDRALTWFRRAREAAGDDRLAHAWTDVFDGAARSDIGDATTAADCFAGATETAVVERDHRLEAFAATFAGREALLAEDPESAVTQLDQALGLARRTGWTAFLGFPGALLAEALRERGDLGRAREVAEHALVLSEQVSDPCWESLSLRSLGLVTLDEGRVESAVELLSDAPVRCRRLPDTYLWIEAFGLEALADVGTRRGLPQAASWVDELTAMTTAHGMHPLTERALRHRRRVGG